MYVGGIQLCEFGNPGADKGAIRVVVFALLYGIVDAEGVDTGNAALHLDLREVDAGFVVNKLTGEEIFEQTPVEPKVVGGKGDEHGSHAEIDPATRFECPHTGIEKRIAGFTVLPGAVVRQVVAVGAQVIAEGMETVVFNAGFVFEFLHEVAVPMEAAEEGAGGAFLDLVFFFVTGGVGDGAEREAAIGDIGG